ncbi:MAG: hypothetical protein DRQ44_09735 [Gammaproteobacteria bacterium]|nr:MAG: hypothetical protein DRQ44_09735 [Gammaproteobacteria bacterium]
MISCALHDYIEIACTFGYEVRLEFFSGPVLQGTARTTETSNDKKEYLLLDCQQKTLKIELVNIKKMTALQPNPHFDSVDF